MRVFCSIWMVLSGYYLLGQEIINVDDIESVNEGEMVQLSEALLDLNFPIDLNLAKPNELLSIPGMNESKVLEIWNHKARFGDFKSLYELQVLPSFNSIFILTLLPYLEVKDWRLTKDWIRDGKGYISLFVSDRVRSSDLELKNSFIGSSFSTAWRVHRKWGDKLKMGLVLEKDYYETLLPVDNISGGVELNNVGRLKRLTLGSFVASFGSGLVYGTGFGGYKSFSLLNSVHNMQGLKGSYTTSEFGKLNGTGVHCSIAKIKVRALASKSMEDAILKTSPIKESVFSSLIKTGLHRTPKEIASKNTVSKSDVALNIESRIKSVNIGLLVSQTKFSAIRKKNASIYSVNNKVDRVYNHKSIYYEMFYGNVLFKGEVAHAFKNQYATVNKLLGSLSKATDILFVYRKYTAGYESFNSKSFGNWSGVENETGLFIGMNHTMGKHVVSYYLDLYKSPWLRHNQHTLSRGFEWALRYTHKKRSKDLYYLMLKRENALESVNMGLPYKAIQNENRWVARFQGNFRLSNVLSWQTRIEFKRLDSDMGSMVYKDFRYKSSKRLKLGIRLTYFSINNFDMRMYSFEQSISGRYSIVGVWGSGVRGSIYGSYKVGGIGVIEVKWHEDRVGSNRMDEASSKLGKGLSFQWKYLF